MAASPNGRLFYQIFLIFVLFVNLINAASVSGNELTTTTTPNSFLYKISQFQSNCTFPPKGSIFGDISKSHSYLCNISNESEARFEVESCKLIYDFTQTICSKPFLNSRQYLHTIKNVSTTCKEMKMEVENAINSSLKVSQFLRIISSEGCEYVCTSTLCNVLLLGFRIVLAIEKYQDEETILKYVNSFINQTQVNETTTLKHDPTTPQALPVTKKQSSKLNKEDIAPESPQHGLSKDYPAMEKKQQSDGNNLPNDKNKPPADKDIHEEKTEKLNQTSKTNVDGQPKEESKEQTNSDSINVDSVEIPSQPMKSVQVKNAADAPIADKSKVDIHGAKTAEVGFNGSNKTKLMLDNGKSENHISLDGELQDTNVEKVALADSKQEEKTQSTANADNKIKSEDKNLPETDNNSVGKTVPTIGTKDLEEQADLDKKEMTKEEIMPAEVTPDNSNKDVVADKVDNDFKEFQKEDNKENKKDEYGLDDSEGGEDNDNVELETGNEKLGQDESATTSKKSSKKGNEINPVAVEFPEYTDSHFFTYFLTVIVLCIIVYLVFHNKQKIIALIIEGRHEQRRRPNTTNYKKLDSNLEEMMQGGKKDTSSTHIIF